MIEQQPSTFFIDIAKWLIVKMTEVSANPLVSIIVRTKDRPKLLRRALQSIAAQTYRPIEVVLVNDGGCELDVEELRAILGDISLNYIRLGKNTGRAHAGNVGIENARGEYIGFLDDDDEFYPEHVETLAEFLTKNKNTIPYTAVEFLEKKYDENFEVISESKKWTFRKEFVYNDMLIANYIPLSALLFEANILKEHSFDESFELYEDWDMLLKLAKTKRFYLIDKITVKYNQWSNTQIAFSSYPDTIKKETVRLYEKWKVSYDLLYDLREENFRKDKIIAEKDNYIRMLEEKINFLETELTNKNIPKGNRLKRSLLILDRLKFKRNA